MHYIFYFAGTNQSTKAPQASVALPKPLKRRQLNKSEKEFDTRKLQLWKPNHKPKATLQHQFTDDHIQVCSKGHVLFECANSSCIYVVCHFFNLTGIFQTVFRCQKGSYKLY